jgi:N-acetylglucosamine-6-phosphate deacetylase
MKKLIIVYVFMNLFCLPTRGAEKDTMVVKGIFYEDGKEISIAILNGKIERIDRLSSGSDTQKVFVAPGLIDLQINGYLGIDFSDQKLTIENIRNITKSLWKVGVTTFLPTVTTNSREKLLKSFSILSGALEDKEIGMSIPGFHLEGPYISPIEGFRGSHMEKYIRDPDWVEFKELEKSAHNGIKMITLAPEVKGAIPFIKKFTDAGVVVSLGHHNGSAELIKQAVEAGATMSTHLGNGCANMIDRHNNPLWPQLADDRLTATIIVDGFHFKKEEVQCFYKMKGIDHTVLVSDIVDLAGLKPGEYTREEKVVVLTPDVVKYPADNVLFGAASPITTDVSNVMKFTDCCLGDAIQMASSNPARSLGLNDIGEIKLGKRADLVLFTLEDGRIVIQNTIVGGKIVYSK